MGFRGFQRLGPQRSVLARWLPAGALIAVNNRTCQNRRLRAEYSLAHVVGTSRGKRAMPTAAGLPASRLFVVTRSKCGFDPPRSKSAFFLVDEDSHE